MGQSRVCARLRAVVVGALTATLLVALAGTTAYADPSISEIERRINTIWADAEPLIEKYNAVHEKYQKNKAKQADLLKQLEPLRRQVDLARLRIGALAAQVYRGGSAGAFSAVLSTGSPTSLADQLTFLDYLTREQQRQISGATE